MAYDDENDTFEATARFKATGSSFVEEVAYDVDEHELLVCLSSGSGYLYKNVPAETFRNFERAHSRGQFYNNWIKGAKNFGPGEEVFWDTEVVNKTTFSAAPMTGLTVSSPQLLTTANSTFPLTSGAHLHFGDTEPVEEYLYTHKVDYTVGGNAYSTTVEAGKNVFAGIDKVVENLDALGLDYEIKGVYVTVNE